MENIRKAALALPEDDRADLARDLLLSLDEPPGSDLGAEYEREIRRRLDSVRNGTANTRDAAEVVQEIRAKYS